MGSNDGCFLVRWRRVVVNVDLFTCMLQLDGSKRLRVDGLPHDAKIVHVSYDPWCGTVTVIVGSESFPEVPVQAEGQSNLWKAWRHSIDGIHAQLGALVLNVTATVDHGTPSAN